MKTKISALITTYNESRFLEECLRRLTFCDEFVVVDLGSTDNCVEIARKFGAKVLFHELVPFGEKVRNYAINTATNDWVLFADPDMYFPRGIEKKIDLFLSDCPDEIGIIHIPARKYFNNRLIQYGQKSAIESRAALINRTKVDFLPLVHYSGIFPKEYILSAGLVMEEGEYIEHYWVNSIKEAVEKSLRYLPYEAERRHNQYKGLSIRAIVKEIIKNISGEITLKAYKDRYAIQIMFFTFWYIFQADVRWINYEIQLYRKKNG